MIYVHYEVILLRFRLSDYKKMVCRKYKVEIRVYFGSTSLQKRWKSSLIVGWSYSIYRSILWSSYDMGGTKFSKYLQNIVYELSLEGKIRSVIIGVRYKRLWLSLVAGQNFGSGHACAFEREQVEWWEIADVMAHTHACVRGDIRLSEKVAKWKCGWWKRPRTRVRVCMATYPIFF